MNRYSKYTLQSALDLTDGLCRYLIQDRCWGPQEILDAEAVVYDFQSEAEQMLWDCLSYGDSTAIGRLRYFLAEDCRVHFVHRMDDRRVVRETARQLTHCGHQVVLEPGLGWAVQVDAATAAPVVPVAVEPEPEVDSALADLKVVLDELVGEQRKKYAQYEAKLATLSDADKAALYGQKAGAGLWEATIGGAVGLVKALPGFAAGYFKTLCKIAMLPSELATATARSMATGDMAPLKAEADKFVQPLAKTYDQAVYYKSVLVTLYEDEQTMGLLNNFANDYWDATHPLERTEMGASAAADIVVTILLALVTAGVGAAANIAAKSARLAKVAKLLDRIAGMLKRTGHRHHMPKKEITTSSAPVNAANRSSIKKHNFNDVRADVNSHPPSNKSGVAVDKAKIDKDDLDKTLKEQNRLLKDKKVELERWDDDAKSNFNDWFGSTDENSRQIIQERTDKMIQLNESYKVDDFKPANPSKDNRYAYVYANDSTHSIYLDKEFFNSGMIGPDSKAGVITHEMSHFTDIGGTKDFVYGPDRAKALAKMDPQDALMNADNYEYYIEGIR